MPCFGFVWMADAGRRSRFSITRNILAVDQKMKRMSVVSTALATGPFVQYVAIAAIAIATWSGRAVILLAALLASDLINPALKKLSSATLPAWLTDRPSGCGSASGENVSCGVFPLFGVCSGTRGTGFPSGHCQSMAVTASFVTRSVLRTNSMTLARKAFTIAAAWLAAMLVVGQRVVVRCHSIPQAIAGLLIGAGAGWVANMAAERAFESSSSVVNAAGACHVTGPDVVDDGEPHGVDVSASAGDQAVAL